MSISHTFIYRAQLGEDGAEVEFELVAHLTPCHMRTSAILFLQARQMRAFLRHHVEIDQRSINVRLSECVNHEGPSDAR